MAGYTTILLGVPTALLTFDNDAASCYDRMIPNLVSLINRRYGLHQHITTLHGNILSSTHYKLRTAAGISEQSHTNTSQTPLYGTGQGAGNSPTIWLLLSSLLFDVYEQQSHGAQFQDSIGSFSTRMGISGFVDDTNVAVNTLQPQHETPI